MTLAQATRYAKKNNLKLVRHIDVQMESKGKRMVYKLLGNKEFFKDQQPSKQEKKTSSYLKVGSYFVIKKVVYVSLLCKEILWLFGLSELCYNLDCFRKPEFKFFFNTIVLSPFSDCLPSYLKLMWNKAWDENLKCYHIYFWLLYRCFITMSFSCTRKCF